MPQFPNQNSGKNLLALHSAHIPAGETTLLRCPCQISNFLHPFTEADTTQSCSNFLIECMYVSQRCLEQSGAHHSQRGIPKSPATDSTPAGLLNPFLITAATHEGALLKHPVFHAAPPHCALRHARLSALVLHKPLCLAFTTHLAHAAHLEGCYRLLKHMLHMQ